MVLRDTLGAGVAGSNPAVPTARREVVKVQGLLKGGPLDERLIEVDDDLLARIDVEDAAGQSHPYCKVGVERPAGQRTEPLAIYAYEPELDAS